MKLSTSLLRQLRLSDPFMIASSHWTASEPALKQLAAVTPSAITLKTTSQTHGGDGQTTSHGTRTRIPISTTSGVTLGYYSDGPKPIELLDVVTTRRLTNVARRLLPHTHIGLSVLSQEPYTQIRNTLATESYAFVELNWKYAFRNLRPETLQKQLEQLKTDLLAFISAFAAIPKLIKLPRELLPFIDSKWFADCLRAITDARAAIIVANSKRFRVPLSRTTHKVPQDLMRGVVVGDPLLLETYDAISRLNTISTNLGLSLPIIASGGVMDLPAILDLMAAGATSVQLCSALDLKGVQFIPALREQLRTLLGRRSIPELITEVRSSPAQWFSTSHRCRQIEFRDKEDTLACVTAPQLLSKVFSGALESELPQPRAQGTPIQRIQSLHNIRFVVNRANILSFLIGLRLVHTRSMKRVDVAGSADFFRKLNTGTLDYDFVVLPKSALQSALKQTSDEQSEKRPHSLGIELGRSTWEIVGTMRNRRLPKRLFHFGGPTSRRVLSELLQTGIGVEEEQIAPQKLGPLLRFWHHDWGILAKQPLSRLYGHVGGPMLARDWKSCWSWSEPLLLAVRYDLRKNRALVNRNGNVVRAIESTLAEIANNIGQAATELATSEMTLHIRELLDD